MPTHCLAHTLFSWLAAYLDKLNENVKIHKTAVLDFVKACKTHGVKHFQLLYSVGES